VFIFKTEYADECQLEEFDYSTNSSEPQSLVNPTNLLASSDEIERNICHPDIPFSTDENELNIIESQTVFQNVVDTVAKQPTSIGTNAAKSLRTNWHEQNSDDPSLNLLNHIAGHISSVRLSPSLQFVHDVHPYQKTQHYTNNYDDCFENKLAPYVMRIQGIKTDADKGKSILPRLKVRIQI